MQWNDWDFNGSSCTWKDPFPLICVINDNYFGDMTYLYISDHFDINKSVQLFFLFLNVLTFGSLSALFIWFTSSQTQPWFFFLYFTLFSSFSCVCYSFNIKGRELKNVESQIHHNIYSHHFFFFIPIPTKPSYISKTWWSNSLLGQATTWRQGVQWPTRLGHNVCGAVLGMGGIGKTVW